jgi:hypothetical protein
MKASSRSSQQFAVCLAVALALSLLPPPNITAQGSSRLFPETGKTVKGRFLEYWDTHGGLPQQGFPISEEIQERSDTDGKTYTVQYFERAVFELHPENQPPFDVLLSLLGVFRYKQKYPTGATGQAANNAPGSRLFSETGHRVGGKFLEYWEGHGGLAQQGLPISDEFSEVSELDRKSYTVQYFERAVFELHPENQPPFDVLLSQLGTFQYRARYLTPAPTATSAATSTAVPTNTPIPAPTNTPIPIDSCEGVPPTNPNEVFLSTTCVPLFGSVRFKGRGFTDTEVGVYATMPNGQVLGAPFNVPVVGFSGDTREVTLTIDEETPYFGVWILTIEGIQTHRKVYGYFKLVPQGTEVP